MALIRDAPRIVADTSLFCRCAETDSLLELATYMGDRVLIVRDVERELAHRKTRAEHATLTMLVPTRACLRFYELLVAPGSD